MRENRSSVGRCDFNGILFDSDFILDKLANCFLGKFLSCNL